VTAAAAAAAIEEGGIGDGNGGGGHTGWMVGFAHSQYITIGNPPPFRIRVRV